MLRASLPSSSLLLLAVLQLCCATWSVAASVSASAFASASASASTSPPPAAALLPLPPVWPAAFNATLIKIRDEHFPSDITWTKLYFTTEQSRFDFYTSYIGLDEEWHHNFTILFTPLTFRGEKYDMVYHIFPDGPGPIRSGQWHGATADPECRIRSLHLPNLSRDWLRSFQLKRAHWQLRGMPVRWWQLPEDPSLNYYHRYDSPQQTPVRSTNQDDDPGATDYVDWMEGPQNDTLFAIPSFCPSPNATLTATLPQMQLRGTGTGTGSSNAEWLAHLPDPFQRHARQQMQKNNKLREQQEMEEW